MRADQASLPIGALAPLTAPGWIEAGRHLVAGLTLATEAVNAAGGVSGARLQLLVRDTAGDPEEAEKAVYELAKLGVVALAGEYHSVAARRVAAAAVTVGLPFLCSSAVIDELVAQPTDLVARIAPPQSLGWQAYAEFLLGCGRSKIAILAGPGPYWQAGVRILRDFLEPRGGEVIKLSATPDAPASVCDHLATSGVAALLLLVGYPEPVVSVVRAVRADPRLQSILLCAPAGQPEFAGWETRVGADGASVPFLRYLPPRLSALGTGVAAELRRRLGEEPSFVALEGYDTIAVLAEALRIAETRRMAVAASWGDIALEGTRGPIQFSRPPGSNVWQWSSAPIQIADRDPAASGCFRQLD